MREPSPWLVSKYFQSRPGTSGEVARTDSFAPDYAAMLADMLSVLQRIAIAQQLPDAIDDSFDDRDAVVDLAGPAYRKTIPAVTYIAILRKLYEAAQEGITCR